LLPGYAYSIVSVKEAKGNQILQLRDPWGKVEWDKDWGHNSTLWTKEIIDEVKPTFGNDGTFWMSFKDFTEHFRALNICKVGDWEELRVRGAFNNDIYKKGGYDNTVKSRYYYEI